MADRLSGTVKMTLAPAAGGSSVVENLTLTAESHTKHLRRSIEVPANTDDYEVPLTDIDEVHLILMSTDNPFEVKYADDAATARSCRKMLLDTPDETDIGSIFITTGTLACAINLLVVGD